MVTTGSASREGHSTASNRIPFQANRLAVRDSTAGRSNTGTRNGSRTMAVVTGRPSSTARDRGLLGNDWTMEGNLALGMLLRGN